MLHFEVRKKRERLYIFHRLVAPSLKSLCTDYPSIICCRWPRFFVTLHWHLYHNIYTHTHSSLIDYFTVAFSTVREKDKAKVFSRYLASFNLCLLFAHQLSHYSSFIILRITTLHSIQRLLSLFLLSFWVPWFSALCLSKMIGPPAVFDLLTWKPPFLPSWPQDENWMESVVTCSLEPQCSDKVRRINFVPLCCFFLLAGALKGVTLFFVLVFFCSSFFSLILY